MTTASAPGGIMEPVETSAASPWETLISGCRPMGTPPFSRKETGLSSRDSMVSMALTAKPSFEAREKPGTSMAETILWARIEPLASLSRTSLEWVAGRCCMTIDWAASSAMRLRNSLGMISAFCWASIKDVGHTTVIISYHNNIQC